MNIRKLLTFLLQAILAIFVLYLLASSWGILTTLENFITPCDAQSDLLTDSTQWRIEASTLPAQILWQKAEPDWRGSGVHLGSPNTSFPISDGQVIYWQISGGLPCDRQPIVATFDTNTGQELWRYRPQEVTHDIFAMTDGYILVGVSGITKLNHQGQAVWQQTTLEKIPFRDINNLYEIGAELYFSTRSEKTYKLSSETGELIGIEAIGQVMALFDHFGLIKSGESNLQLIDLAKNRELVYTIDLPSEKFQNAPLNPRFLIALKNRNILFLCLDSTSFEAYDFDTGQRLWEFDKPLYGIPAIASGMLVVYTLDNRFEIYNPANGDLLGSVTLVSNNDSKGEVSRFSAWITAYQNTIFVRQIDSFELIAVKLDLSKIISEG